MPPDYRVLVVVRVEMPGTQVKDPDKDPEGFAHAYRAAPLWEDVLCSPGGVTIAIACHRGPLAWAEKARAALERAKKAGNF